VYRVFQSAQISQKFETKNNARAPHPAYSQDLSPYDCWFVGTVKGKMKGGVFRNEAHFRGHPESQQSLEMKSISIIHLQHLINIESVTSICQSLNPERAR
jgi:hypothetical protein